MSTTRAIEALEAEVERLKEANSKLASSDLLQSYEAMQAENAKLRAQLAAAQGQTKTRAEECRGYALLGTGQYCINHTLDFDHELGAELVITLATDEDKSGNRQVGESRDNPEPGKPIQPEDMVIRIGFLSECGLFALEDQLAWVRKLHFAAAPIPQQASVPAECCEHCDDGDGLCVFPMYGPAPHIHDTSSGWIGSTRTLPKEQWGNNFREDPDCKGHGVYMRCEKCGRGEQPAAAAPQPKTKPLRRSLKVST